jgi:hypothetical protein
MSNVLVTVTAYGNSTVQDLLGLEAYARPGSWVSQSFSFGTTVSFEMTGNTWSRVRSLLNVLSQKRIPAMDAFGVPLNTGKYQPAITYSMDWVPGDRPRVHQVESVPVSLAVPGALTLRGTNLLGGLAASSTLQAWSASYSYGFPGTRTYTPPVDALRITALAKGPGGNLISYAIKPDTGAGSVTVTLSDDGGAHIEIVPAAGASTSTAIDAQLAGSAAASRWVSSSVLSAGQPIAPTLTGVGGQGPSPGGRTPSSSGLIDRVYLGGGDGGGLAYLDLPVSGAESNRLRITSQKAGNQNNLITVTLVASSGAPGVTVSGNNITVAFAAAARSLTNIANDINTDPAAQVLVVATIVGAGANTLGSVSKSWLNCGGGETPVATVAGAVATVTAQTDTSMVITTTNAALVAAGALAGEEANVQIQMNYGLVTTSIGAIAP